jgi:hypothetical protein
LESESLSFFRAGLLNHMQDDLPEKTSRSVAGVVSVRIMAQASSMRSMACRGGTGRDVRFDRVAAAMMAVLDLHAVIASCALEPVERRWFPPPGC